jgi:hypothetical protein
LQTFGGSKLGSIKLEAGAETLIECNFLKMNPSHYEKKTGNVKNGKKSKKNRKIGGVWEFIAFRK